jgi:AraC-like DNA-binding protein
LQILAILNTGDNLFSVKNLNRSLPSEFSSLLNQIEKNFTDFNTVSDISQKAFVSTATINRWFRKYLHLSPKEYLLAKKLSYAKSLLAKGDTVAEAGYQAGFFDSSHFISVFKKRFKETPFNYKKQFNE